MKIRTVTSLRRFDELSGLWREVTEAGGQKSVFLSHDWFASCWRTAGPSRTRELWIVEDSAGPIALIPLVGTKMRYRGFPARVLQLMHPPEAPIVDFPVSRDRRDVLITVLERLNVRGDWDLFLIPGLRVNSPTWSAFKAAAGTRIPWRIADRQHVPSVTLTKTDPAVGAIIEKLHRSVEVARARSLDTVVVEQHRTIDPRGAYFEEIMGVTRPRSQGSATLPQATAEEVRRFFRELTARAGANGWLSLWVLRYEGRVVETEYQLISDGSVHTLRRDSDQSPAELCLGEVLTVSVLETLLAKSSAHTYFRAAIRPANGAPLPAGEESLFLEVFANRPYAQLLYRVETHVLPFARRFTGSGEHPCA